MVPNITVGINWETNEGDYLTKMHVLVDYLTDLAIIEKLEKYF